jgi:hypothetical protein
VKLNKNIIRHEKGDKKLYLEMLESLVKKPSSLLEGTAELVASHFQPLQQLQ